MISTEALLVIVVYGLYAIDGCLLLYENEGLLIPVCGRRWRVRLSQESRCFFGRLLFFPNFFAVGFRFYRCYWHPTEAALIRFPKIPLIGYSESKSAFFRWWYFPGYWVF
jgi:predicted metal-dependent hydrolase